MTTAGPPAVVRCPGPPRLRRPITSRFDTTEGRDQVVAYGAEKGAIGGWVRLDAILKRLAAA
jgi:hypothetical protein